MTDDRHVTPPSCVFEPSVSVFSLCFWSVYDPYCVSCCVFKSAQSLCASGSQGERRQGWEALMGKWASALSPPLESSLKGLERWCRGLFSFSLPPPPLMFFSLPLSLLQQRRSPAAGDEPKLWPSSSCTSEKHTTLMTSSSWNKAPIHQKTGKACYER